MGELIKSIYAGLMIGIGGTIYLSIENKILGAILFSFGLLTIIIQGFNLYTGRVGYDIKNPPLMFKILIGNTIGTFICALLVRLSKPEIINKANQIWLNKLNQTALSTLVLAVLCGVLMYLAVDNYKKNNNLLFIMLPVIIFILSGYEHSIANLFYMFLCNNIKVNQLWYIVICILGNSIGARLFHIFKSNKGE